ncbi:alanine racemase [Psychrobium sp. 1_MG-2023]|uniref:alanine racemase n=1 Tax=Psychrobium sp. 1_MG-2023 TaxID=3062624 RepID=UPI000C34FB41|nr:alanine racemase [Psychrobium sp. 1_MG-2023]MDP2560650.1 alanine racemase [Psychrobium sp. 1_MG-2023]PKF56547.1 alanine racemase [Alteromonadales bacterium alter-6D02]
MSTVNALISRKAVLHNFNRINSLAPHSKIISVLKANAYGHGLLEMANILTDTDAIGVARLEEALALRAGGVVKPILLLEGFFQLSDIEILLTNNLQTVIHSLEQVEMLEQISLSGQLNVWLKVDTGMNRLGIHAREFEDIIRRLKNIDYIAQPFNYMTHFACADDLNNPFTQQQAEQFYQLVDGQVGELTLANSAAILAWPQTHADWIRPGLLLYGCSPMINRTGKQDGFEPAMTLTSSVIAIKSLQAGEKVGYGSSWSTTQDTTLAVVAIGYGDGYPRHAKTGTPVLINGQRFPIVGRVSMDMITVDIGLQHQVRCGDDVTLWGAELPVEEVAQYADTICYELILQLTSRVNIQFID